MSESPIHAAIAADNRDRAHVLVRETAEVVRQPHTQKILALPLDDTAKHLQIHFVDHTKAGRTDRVTEALQAPVDLARDVRIRRDKFRLSLQILRAQPNHLSIP